MSMSFAYQLCGTDKSRSAARGILALRTAFLAVFVAGAFHASEAGGKQSLRDVPEIENRLFAVAVASEVAKQCDSIRARRLKGFNVLMGLRRKANQLGYTDAEIRTYVESDTEKDRMRSKGYKYLKSEGVDPNTPETFCVFGRAEIEKSSAIGALLKAR